MRKIAIVGPESSGKSTLCKKLAGHYHGTLVPEFARTYLDERSGNYKEEDLVEIARHQDQMIRKANKDSNMLFADTEVLVIRIWSLVKFGRCSPEINELWINQNFDLYLLCAPDLPWKPDPLREIPEKKGREDIFDLFLLELRAISAEFCVVSGNDRFGMAVERIDLLK